MVVAPVRASISTTETGAKPSLEYRIFFNKVRLTSTNPQHSVASR